MRARAAARPLRRFHAARDHGRGRDPGHSRRAGRAERHPPHRRCERHQGEAGHPRARNGAQPVPHGQLPLPDDRPGARGAGQATGGSERAQLETGRLRPSCGRIPGATTTPTSRPARAASTTSTRSAPMDSRVARAPMPTSATGTSRSDRAGLTGPSRRRSPRASRCSRSWSSSSSSASSRHGRALGQRARRRSRDGPGSAAAAGHARPGARGIDARWTRRRPARRPRAATISCVTTVASMPGSRSSAMPCSASGSCRTGSMRALRLESRDVELKTRSAPTEDKPRAAAGRRAGLRATSCPSSCC